MRLRVNEEIAELAVLGGAFLGGGGGGDMNLGLDHAKLAISLGEVEIVDLDSVPEDGYIITASLVGAPAAKEKYVLPSHMVKAVDLLRETIGTKVCGIISSENGGYSTINGWIASSLLGIPIVDAPADGRAHPTGLMGAMGLHKVKDYVSIQTAVGGNKEEGRFIELVVKGSLERASRMIREAAVQAGGLVAVARNPVRKDYLRGKAAIGGITQAIEVGMFFKKYRGDLDRLSQKIIEFFGGGRVIERGRIKKVKLETKGGFDVGKIIFEGNRDLYEITFWNEFMTLENSKGERLGTFPDLISMIDTGSSIPLTSAEAREGAQAILMVIPKDKLLLGEGVRDPDVLREIEGVIIKKVLGGDQ